MELNGKIALVTGAARRVGKVIALTLARGGAHVAITYNHSEKEARATVAEIEALGVRCLALQVNLSQSGAVDKMAALALERFGRVDILVNNAAVFLRTPLATLREADWDDTMNANLKGPFLTARAFGQRMVKQGSGKIINIGDWAGVRPYVDYIPYCVSKAGVIALTKNLALALAPQVQVNCVCPGPVLPPEEYSEADRAEIIAATPLKRLGSPTDIAAAVLFLIEGSDFITGSILMVDGGRLIGPS
ncbi:MAG: SDR family oxidoreductase [Acidobacteria bacterium]|nr:SDR family oxidoreductase [Acidobacteriota bacterium]MBI3655677.1 SDR family oxidoreductase [Acidobacteriota bacterium]